MPEPKNGERPYLAVPEPTFWGAIFRYFSGIFVLPQHNLLLVGWHQNKILSRQSTQARYGLSSLTLSPSSTPQHEYINENYR